MTTPRAHPRSRGEHLVIALVAWLLQGSSPLTRGAPRIVFMNSSAGGLIPAHAGSTLVGRIHRHCHGAHPRSRGEHPALVDQRRVVRGSSPLTRGARWIGGRSLRPPGLIPAHAGSTSYSSVSAPPRQAHPRSRGEHHGAPHPKESRQGSSPLTRGARLHGCGRVGQLRLIPAHAGSTGADQCCEGYFWAHPRSRGEHALIAVMTWLTLGSSPLTRGARTIPRRARRYPGLIPAHAGSTVRI